MKYVKQLINFLKDVANDIRIPDKDKKILLVLVALVLSPFDIIPDWLPIIGWMDDLVIVAIILDYFFNHLDQNILLSHYPWGMKSYVRIRKTANIITFLAPKWVKRKVWTYKPEIY